jgi:hypothetical protein
MAAMVCLVGMTRDAGATVTIDLVWSSTSGGGSGAGTSTITALPGDTLELSVILSNNQTLAGHFFSVNFDTDLADELNLLGAGNWTGSTFGTGTMQTAYVPLGAVGPNVESSGIIAGRINTYNSGATTGTLYLPTGTYTVGTARFVVTGNVSTDGLDLFSGLFNTGFDTIGDNASQPIPSSALVFNSASVNVIPEPGTVSLLGLGLVGLVLAGRRSRRS